MHFIERERGGEKAILVHIKKRQTPIDAEEEFRELALSAGAQILEERTARVDKPTPATLLGSGKVEELAERVQSLAAELVLIDAELSPVQERNLEAAWRCRVVDRTALILDIFAARAQSHEGKLEVELAQLKHLATRLVRGWTHLERQRGGAIGLRGPGETQLETDRRLLSKRVDFLSAKLREVEKQRATGRKSRARAALKQVALVGYTNAGKSTLFNALTGAQSYAADQLFATLDPTVRRVDHFDFGAVLLADTVGFVRDLPHELVAAFRSTLTEAREADLLLHVIDAADPLALERINAVNEVLEGIGAGALPQILVFNKSDLLEQVPRSDERRVYLSAKTNQGFDALVQAMGAALSGGVIERELMIPFEASQLRARLLHLGVVVEESLVPEAGYQTKVKLPRSLVEQLASLPGVSGKLVRQKLMAATDASD
jgi:GTP-binding protein HflX